jgi:uncharacterized membrane protein YbhN (UPF0104 family)
MRLLRALVSVSLLGLLAWRADWNVVAHLFRQLRLELWLVAVSLYVVAQCLSAFRWRLLAEPMGFQRPLKQFLAYYFISMFFNLFLPTSVGGDVWRACYLDNRSGRWFLALLTVIMDRVSGLLVLLMLAAVALIACPIALPVWVKHGVGGTVGMAMAAMIALVLLERRHIRWTPFQNLMEALRHYQQRPKLWISANMISFFVQSLNVVIVWLLGSALSMHIPASYYWITVPMVTLMTLLPVSINGMGVREAGMVLFLSPLGVAESASMSLGSLWFSVFAFGGLLGAVPYLLGSFQTTQEPFHDRSVGGDSNQGRAPQPKAAA